MTAEFDAILIGGRKSKDGETVTFAIHHADLPHAQEIRDAYVGSQWKITATPLDDDGNAKEAQPVRAKRSWDEMTPAQQAGVLCADKSFCKFLETDDPAEAVRNYCDVRSRADITPGSINAARWQELVAEYRAWMREPSVVPA